MYFLSSPYSTLFCTKTKKKINIFVNNPKKPEHEFFKDRILSHSLFNKMFGREKKKMCALKLSLFTGKSNKSKKCQITFFLFHPTKKNRDKIQIKKSEKEREKIKNQRRKEKKTEKKMSAVF